MNQLARRIKYRLLDAADRLRYLAFGWRTNVLFAAQTPGHWLNQLLRPLRGLWLAWRLLWGLTRGIGPAGPGDDLDNEAIDE